MVFSSPVFLFTFFPIFYVIYFALGPAYRNAALLISSIVFYAYGSGPASLILILSIPLNQMAAAAMRRASTHKTPILAGAIVANALPLIIYKYLDFLTGTVNDALSIIGATPMQAAPRIVLPPGISFFTFQAISYLCDVHSGAITRLPRLVDFGMYHTSFPQLVAGPIVRYVEIERDIVHRPIRLQTIHDGIMRFCFGLAKKIIIADNLGTIADRIFGLDGTELTSSLAWLGAITYTLQIFFDFSGYSDMAIGLASMLGFRFPENFNQPYRSCSITEFWRRWHMTLSRWFRDYIYIPLGGNRRSGPRTVVNLYIVFFLCGLWHGASYNFVVWGIFHGTLLAIERLFLHRTSRAPAGLIGWSYTALMVLLGWIIFRAPTLPIAFSYMHALVAGAPSSRYSVAFFLTPDKLTYLAAGIALALLPKFAGRRLVKASPALAALCFAYTITQVAANGFNPFIYFRF